MLWWQVGLSSSVALGLSEVPMEGTEPPLHNNYVCALRGEEAYLQADDEKPQIVEPFDAASIVCQFCGKSYEQVPRLFEAKRKVRDPNTDAIASVWICNECVGRIAQILAEELPGTRFLWWWRFWSPGGLMRP
jgi:hypothetical protein